MTAANDRFERGAELLRGRRFREADCCAREGLRDCPDDGRLWQLHGTARWALGDYLGACSALETASALRPLYPLARCALADAYVRTGRSEVARVIYRHLAEGDGCPTELLPKVVAGLGQLEEYEPALKVCRRLVDRNPSHHAAFFGIAYYLALLDSPPGPVLEALHRAFDLAPHVLVYRLNLAWLLAGVGQGENAYALLCAVPVEEVSCPFWLRRMLAVFETAGDEHLSQACRERLEGR
jgi:tetratricopeptide (TPR) repeat protein